MTPAELTALVKFTPRFTAADGARAYAARNGDCTVIAGDGVWWAAAPDVAARLIAAGYSEVTA
jgi:hypothetical protein